MKVILSFGIIFLAGLLAVKLLRRIKFPAVTAYLLLGILIGPAALNLVPEPILNASGSISNIALSFIAFSLGQNFSRENFSKIGRSVIWISILEASGAWLCVTFAFLILLKKPLYLSLLFGAIASATAPAATVMVIREYRAKGAFTDTLLGVVAIDDAWCLIIFATCLALAKAIAYPVAGNLLLFKAFLRSLLEIGGAFFLGTASALALSYFSRYIKAEADLLILSLGFILLNAGFAVYLHFSVLLTNMFLGMILVNIDKTSFRFFDSLRRIDLLLYLCFFVLAGANLQIGLLQKVGWIGLTYLLFRIMGKITGASLGGYLSRAAEPVRRYIGLGLVPQAGIALGVALIAKLEFPELGGMVFTAIIATTVIYEIIGPFCTKFALAKAGEISNI